MTAPTIPYAPQSPTPYTHANSLAKATIAFLGADIVLDALIAVFSLLDYRALHKVDSHEEYMETFTMADGGFMVIGLFSSGVLLGLLIAWCLWQYRVHTNLLALGRSRGPMSPGWGVGVWFIPIVNLVLPFLVMRHIFVASASAADSANMNERRGLGWVSAWWALWIVTSLAAYSSLAKSTAEDLGVLRKVALVDVGAALLSAITTALAIMIVREIQRRQDASTLETPGLSIKTGR
jgi:hypothetical protein